MSVVRWKHPKQLFPASLDEIFILEGAGKGSVVELVRARRDSRGTVYFVFYLFLFFCSFFLHSKCCRIRKTLVSQ